MSTTSDDGSAESGEEFTVERILATRRRHGKRQFFIRWKGYGPDEDTWEPEENCDCTELIEEFLAAQRAAKRGQAGGRPSQRGGGQPAPQRELPAAATDADASATAPVAVPAVTPAEDPQPQLQLQPCGFERGLEPEKIVGAAKHDGRLFLQVRWRNNTVDIVPASEVNQRCPELVIAFYEASVSWYQDDDEDAPI